MAHKNRPKKDIIHVNGAAPGWRLTAKIQKLLGGLRKLGELPRGSIAVLSVSCVDARPMAELNFAYRKKRGTTDVLSFEQKNQPPGEGLRFLGDIVLCVPVVQHQAKEQGHSVQIELNVLLTHGILHLLGYDHEKSRAEAAKMARAEAKLLEASGLVTPGLISRGKVKKRT